MNFKLIVGFSCLLLISVCSSKQVDFGGTDYQYDSLDDEASGAPVVEEDEVILQDVQVPEFEQKSQKISVKEFESIKLDCRSKNPKTEHVLIFEHFDRLVFVGDTKVGQDTRFVAKDSTFELSDIQRSDSGNYTCAYQLQGGKYVSITYEVDVQYRSKVSSKTPKTQTVKKGSSVSVECQAEGNPKPVISWSKAKGKLPSGEKSEEGYMLTLENVDRHVEGTYVCTAENGIGKPSSLSKKIVVEYPPEIFTEKDIIHNDEGDVVELVCIVHARPVATLTWSRNGSPLESNPGIQEVTGGHRHTLMIQGINEETFGAYECAASNPMGKDSAVLNLSVEPKKPQFTSPATSTSETMYALTWETESYYPITDYTVKYRLAKANVTSELPGEWHEESVTVDEDNLGKEVLIHKMEHNISDLVSATDYQASVIVKNKLKEGEEATFNFSTMRAVITTSLPSNLDGEKALFSHKEEFVKETTTVGSGHYHRLSVAILLVTLAVSLSS